MKKLLILFAFFFCAMKTHAQDKNTIFETINLLSAFADVFKIQPQSGHPFEAFLQDTARINNNIRSLQKYFDTDTFPVVCVAVEFLSFNQFNDSTKLLSQTQFRKFLKNTPRATIGINKFFSLHRVDHDSMYQYFLSRVDPVLYFSFNQIFYDYRAKDALILSMEKKEHNFVGIGDTGIVSFADKIALMCKFIPQIRNELVPLITKIHLQLQLANLLQVKEKTPNQKLYLPIPPFLIPYVNDIGRSLKTYIPINVLSKI